MDISIDHPTKAEIWETVRIANDAWTKGDPTDLTNFFHPHMIAITPTVRGRLESGASCVAGWKKFREGAQIHSWKEVSPVINLFGDAAVVAYEYEMEVTMAGKKVGLTGRDMMFVVREGGKWWVVADQFSPQPG